MAYVDGFNLYYGLKSKGWQRYYWLDVRHLAENLLRPGQSLEAVRYFTARIRPQPNDPGKPARQDTYLQALATLPELPSTTGTISQEIGVAPSAERLGRPTRRR